MQLPPICCDLLAKFACIFITCSIILDVQVLLALLYSLTLNKQVIINTYFSIAKHCMNLSSANPLTLR